MRVFQGLLVMTVVLGLSNAVQAAAATSLLFDKVVNKLEDDDFDTLVDFGMDGSLDVGDFLVGMFQIQNVVNNVTLDSNPPTTNTFTGVFVQKAVSKTPGGQFGGPGAVRIGFAPLTDPEWTALQGVFPALPSRMSSGTMILVFDDPEDVAGGPAGPFIDPTNGGGIPGINAGLATAVNGQILWEVGFRDGDEVFVADVETDVIGPGSPSLLDFRAWLNTTYADPSVAHIQLIDHLTVTAPPFAPTVTPPAGSEWQIDGGLGSGSSGDFAVATDTDVFILPLIAPEPSATLVWMGLAFCFAALVWARRRLI